MDRLIDDYEKALQEKLISRDRMEGFEGSMKFIEAEQLVLLTAQEPKLPQWKAAPVLLVHLDTISKYKAMRGKFLGAEHRHNMAEIGLAVAYERIELTKARLYGGRHDLLDMQEVAPTPDQDVD